MKKKGTTYWIQIKKEGSPKENSTISKRRPLIRIRGGGVKEREKSGLGAGLGRKVKLGLYLREVFLKK